MKWKVMISAPYMQPVLDKFRPFFKENDIEIIVPPVRERMEETELLEVIADIDGVICGDDRFTARVLEQAPKLKVIAKWGTGIDSIDRERAEELGIAVYNTPNAFTEPVADSVFSFMLSFARKIPWSTQAIKQGVWEKLPGFTLSEATLGIVGVGNIGKAIVRRAAGFGMKVIGNDIQEVDVDINMVSFEELLTEADIVTINCDLNPTSFHLIGEKEFAKMKSSAYIINTARGPIIDEKALVRALESGTIAGAGLDVFEDEPLPQDSPLKKMDNCLFSAHNANSSPVAWSHVHQNTIKNLLKGLSEGRKVKV